MKKTNQEKILIFMLDKEEWKVSDFTDTNKPHFVGYKAGSRINELIKDFWYVEHHRDEGRFAVYRLTDIGRQKAKSLVGNRWEETESLSNGWYS